MFTSQELDFIDNLRADHVTLELLGKDTAAQTEAVYTLYAKLTDAGCIQTRGKHPLVYVLGNITLFNLSPTDPFRNLLMFLVGEIKACQLPMQSQKLNYI